MKTNPPENAGISLRSIQYRIIRFGGLVAAVVAIVSATGTIVAKYSGWMEIPGKVDKAVSECATNQMQIDQLQRQFGDLSKIIQQNAKFEEECRNAATQHDRTLIRIEQKVDDLVERQKEIGEDIRAKR